MTASANAYQPPSSQVDIVLPKGPVTDRPEVVGVFPIVHAGKGGILAMDVYVEATRLVAVKTGGQLAANGTNAITIQFGLLGVLIAYFLKKRADKQMAAMREDRRTLSLDELIRVDPKNFEVRFADVQKALFKKPGFFGGGHTANLELSLGQKKPTVLMLKTKDAFETCRTSLATAFGPRLEIDPKLKF